MQEDLIRIFEIATIHYNIIGIGLGVDVAGLIQQPQSDTNKLILVFKRWIDSNNNITWGKILEVCEDYPNQLGQAKASLGKFLSSEETCRKYLQREPGDISDKIPDEIVIRAQEDSKSHHDNVPPPDKNCCKKIGKIQLIIILIFLMGFLLAIIYHSHFHFEFEW